jgi:hypothetical protein
MRCAVPIIIHASTLAVERLTYKDMCIVALLTKSTDIPYMFLANCNVGKPAILILATTDLIAELAILLPDRIHADRIHGSVRNRLGYLDTRIISFRFLIFQFFKLFKLDLSNSLRISRTYILDIHCYQKN